MIPATGLTVLVDPHEASLDIVFVHGFNGHPERTWTHKRGDAKAQDKDGESQSAEPPPKVRKFNSSPWSRQKNRISHTAVYWPRDLIQETVPNARVFTFGYDTHPRHLFGRPVNKSTVYEIAGNFLVVLEAKRRSEPLRPVLFIAHSLGGIVVKEMLRRSSSSHRSQPHLHELFKSTIGIMFFGTPHGGADPRGFLLRVAEKAIRAAGFSFNEQIVDALLPSSERLRELRDEFSPIAHEQGWIIYSFQEELGVQVLGGKKVVENGSSYLNFPNLEITQPIGRDHMGMCRFTGLEDAEYEKVAAALRRMTDPNSRKPRRGESPSLNEEQRRALLDSLRFDQIDARQTTIKNGHAKTCKWLLNMPEYLDWLDTNKLVKHYGFLWVKGKPGTGKSTLMKFAHAHARKTLKNRIIISFFFNARGEDLEKSTAGMYRSLLLQLLESAPELRCVFNLLRSTTRSGSRSHQWNVETLKELFEQAIQLLGQRSLMCFIDALDECEERQIRDMVSFFEQLGESSLSAGIQFQVCFSSRHYPHITISKGLDLVLEGQEGHDEDITNYLNSELKIGHGKLAEEIRGELQTKASGIFMWVALVVEILNKENDSGRVHVLRQKLRDIPNDLHQLFHQILTRDCHNRDELQLCIQWVLFAKQPLNPKQLYFAIISGIAPEGLGSWNPDEITSDVIKKFILNSSKGLAEITKSRTPTVQFIHESVRDYLIKENVLSELFPDLGDNFRGQSHERLKQCCLTYMRIHISTQPNLGKPLPKASSEEAEDIRELAAKVFPFLEYAGHLVLYHAEAAQSNGIHQGDFIQNFPLADWIKLNNLFSKYETRRHKPKASLLYILAERNMSNLIRVHPNNLSYLEVEEKRYGLPLFAAAATGSQEAIQAFIELEMDKHNTTSEFQELYSQSRYNESKHAAFGGDFRFSKRRTILSYVAEYGDEILVAFLLDIRKDLVDMKDNNDRTPLSWAAQHGQKAVVRLLLKTGKVDTNSRDKSTRTPLLWAAEGGHTAVVGQLLANPGIAVNAEDKYGRTPLSWAAEGGHTAVVCQLLAVPGIAVNAGDKYGRTPLSWAAEGGHTAVVYQLLAVPGIDVNTIDQYGRTLLLWAAVGGHTAVVYQLLAVPGIDVNAIDKYGRTPLLWAAERGHAAVVDQLLAVPGIDVNTIDQYGRTLLLWAVMRGHTANIGQLLAVPGIDVNAVDRYERTPLSWAAEEGRTAIVGQLLAVPGIDVNVVDKDGKTPLSWAAKEGHTAVVGQLLAVKGINIIAAD